jgi:2-polyprenyl-6-methoxyphenol hydroxylase-like FAD-dependent oxidoreductase
MTSARTADVLIAGGGIGGLTAALALHARGIDAVVLESAARIRPEGVGINIQPAAIAELTALGLGDALAATGIATREHRYFDHTGTVLWGEPRGLAAGHPFPQYSLHRGELQMLLLAAVHDRLGPDAVRTGVRLTSFEQDADGVRAEAADRATGTTTGYLAGLLVGADGLHSAVRSRLHPDQAALSVSGVDMWRGLTELDGFLDGRTMILVNDGRDTRMIAYPCSAAAAARGRALVNWVCMVPVGAPGKADPGWDRPGRLADVLPHFEHWDLGWLRVADLLAGSERILQYPMVDRDPLARWGSGRVTLLGDAAHLMYPIGANGASQAIVDAAVLAAELAGGHDVVAALQRYEDVRRPATTAIVLANRDMDRAERALSADPAQDKSAALAALTSSYRTTVDRAAARSPLAGGTPPRRVGVPPAPRHPEGEGT